MFEYIFSYEVNQWFLNDIAQKFWKIMGFQKKKKINSHDVQLVNWGIFPIPIPHTLKTCSGSASTLLFLSQ